MDVGDVVTVRKVEPGSVELPVGDIVGIDDGEFEGMVLEEVVGTN